MKPKPKRRVGMSEQEAMELVDKVRNKLPMNKPKKKPEWEKEFDELWIVDICGGHFNKTRHYQKLKSFIQKTINEEVKKVLGEKDNWADMRHNKSYLVGDIVKHRNDLRDEQLKRLEGELK